MGRSLLLSAALGFGWGTTATLVFLWWYSSTRGWIMTVDWNKYNEALLEGVLLHVGLTLLTVVGALAPRWLHE